MIASLAGSLLEADCGVLIVGVSGWFCMPIMQLQLLNACCIVIIEGPQSKTATFTQRKNIKANRQKYIDDFFPYTFSINSCNSHEEKYRTTTCTCIIYYRMINTSKVCIKAPYVILSVHV